MHYIDVKDEYHVIILAGLKETKKRPKEEDPDWVEEEQHVIISQSNNSYSEYVTNTLRDWIFAHSKQPYPTEQEKIMLSQKTGLTIVQINNWMSNARRRILKKVRFTRPKSSKY